MIRRVWAYRYLVISLARRQYQIRYRQSFVGVAWAVILPLATLGVGTVIFKRLVGVNTVGTSYELATLAAVVPWTFFASSLTFGVGSVVQDRSMVTKLAFPRGALPLGAIGSSFIDLAIAAAIFLILTLVTGNGLSLTALWSPVLLVIEFALVVGIVLLGSALNVFARDVRLGLPLLVQFWLLLTPVMYPLSSVPESLRDWYLANPMAGLVESFRQVMALGNGIDFALLWPAMVGATALLVLGAWYFSATESRFADVI